MIFLLDANAVSALTRERLGFMEKTLGHGRDAYGIPAIVAFELYYGAYRHERTAHYLRLIESLQLEIVPFEAADARAAGHVRAELQRRGTPIGPFDTLIAGQALARDLVLITRNMREFSRIDGLRVENWET